MANQVQKEKTETAQKEAPTEAKPKNLEPTAAELKAKADEIIDMIDDVLEKNAEEFVQNYVQRGGE